MLMGASRVGLVGQHWQMLETITATMHIQIEVARAMALIRQFYIQRRRQLLTV